MNISKKIITVVVFLGACALIAPQQVVAMQNLNPQDANAENLPIEGKIMAGLGAIAISNVALGQLEFFIKGMTILYDKGVVSAPMCTNSLNATLFWIGWIALGCSAAYMALKLAEAACPNGTFFVNEDGSGGLELLNQ